MGISWLSLVRLVTSLKGGPVRAIDGYLPQDRGIVDSGYDSLNVRFVGNWPFGPSYAVAVDEERELVYLGSGGGVYILDVSDPGSPVKVSALKTRGIVADFFYDSLAKILYIADLGGGLRVIDVSDPSNPQEVGYCDTPSWANGVYVVGGYAYVVDYDGLRIIDVSDPSDPQEVGYCDTPGWANGVYVVGGYAYVADYDGLRIIDVSDPSDPQEVGYCNTPSWAGWANGVYVVDGYAYVADEGGGLRVIDVSDPSDPQEVGYCDTPGWANGVYVVGGYAYVADLDGGLQIYQNLLYSVEENESPEGLLNVASLYDGSKVHLRFNLPERSFVRLKVYDVLGRLVDYPLNGEMGPGGHDLIFRPEVKGVYFYRLEMEGYVKKGKFLVF